MAGRSAIMKRGYSFSLIVLPLMLLVALASGLFVQRAGIQYSTGSNDGSLQILPEAVNLLVADYFPDKPVEALVVYDPDDTSTEKHVQTVFDTLDSMRVKYEKFDVNSSGKFDPSKYQTVILSLLDLDKIGSQMLPLTDWVGAGGKVLFSIRPEPSATFTTIYRKLGIVTKEENLVQTNGAEFISDLFPRPKGANVVVNYLTHFAYSLQLSADNRVHIVSADEKKIPLLWEHDFEKGRFVFINTDQTDEKDGRGLIGAAYSLLPDVFVYPVINASVYYIDDFPSPIPAGSYDLIAQQYNMDIDNFYTNVWWPDIDKISKTYKIKYTGVDIEDYNFDVNAPFDARLDTDRHRYFGGLILAAGGEIGFHGYNHVPFCMEDTGINQLYEYPGWPTTEDMQLSVLELYRFSKSLFPNNAFTTYVPPSNILCSDARLWLPTVLPGLKVIASEYILDPEKTHYAQEFTEASDGIIEFPRLTSGFAPDPSMTWVDMTELWLHYVQSHFFHPDDLLDPDRGALEGWAFLRDRFEEYVKWISDTAPGLRNMTAREGAAAVQRFARIAVKTENINGLYQIDLGNFNDEAWLMMRTTKKPASIDGGTISTVTPELYLIKALKPKVTIKFEGANP
jgi:hypothetical protein